MTSTESTDFNEFNRDLIAEFRANDGDRANPEVTVELPGETFRARATALTEGPERDRLYRAQADLMPNFGEYEQRTDRKIAVVVLDRIE